MALKIKKGVVLVLTNNHTAFILEVMMKGFESVDADCVVTSGVEGKHGDDSKHYTLEAMDFRGNHIEKDVREQVVEYAKAALNEDAHKYDVVDSSDGAIHIEYDPKG